MSKNRMLGFFDAVLAIIMTMLVVGLDPPAVGDWAGLWAMRSKMFAYALSYLYLGTTWVQHVYAWRKAQLADSHCLWSTLLLLFASSLVPFATSWVASDPSKPAPAVVYVLITITVTLASLHMNRIMYKVNVEAVDLSEDTSQRRRWLLVVLAIQCTGLVVAFILPDYALLPVLVGVLYIISAKGLEPHISNCVAFCKNKFSHKSKPKQS